MPTPYGMHLNDVITRKGPDESGGGIRGRFNPQGDMMMRQRAAIQALRQKEIEKMKDATQSLQGQDALQELQKRGK